MSPMKCPTCGKRITTWKSLLGGRCAEWHKPKRGVKAPTLGKSEYCLFSGTVLNEPRP